jgi:hypothetical protein
MIATAQKADKFDLLGPATDSQAMCYCVSAVKFVTLSWLTSMFQVPTNMYSPVIPTSVQIPCSALLQVMRLLPF